MHSAGFSSAQRLWTPGVSLLVQQLQKSAGPGGRAGGQAGWGMVPWHQGQQTDDTGCSLLALARQWRQHAPRSRGEPGRKKTKDLAVRAWTWGLKVEMSTDAHGPTGLAGISMDQVSRAWATATGRARDPTSRRAPPHHLPVDHTMGSLPECVGVGRESVLFMERCCRGHL